MDVRANSLITDKECIMNEAINSIKCFDYVCFDCAEIEANTILDLCDYILPIRLHLQTTSTVDAITAKEVKITTKHNSDD